MKVVTQQMYDDGIRCKCICMLCNEKFGCVQYINEVKQTPQKPPLGLTPKNVWLEERLQEIKNAINRYSESDYPIPKEWIDEYNEILNLINNKEINLCYLRIDEPQCLFNSSMK